jgi:hypothetical protein
MVARHRTVARDATVPGFSTERTALDRCRHGRNDVADRGAYDRFEAILQALTTAA